MRCESKRAADDPTSDGCVPTIMSFFVSAHLRAAFEASRFQLCWRVARWGLAAID
jgi:hypothetical protein